MGFLPVRCADHLPLDRFTENKLPTVGTTGQSINELENGPSSYKRKRIYFAWVFMKP